MLRSTEEHLVRVLCLCGGRACEAMAVAQLHSLQGSLSRLTCCGPSDNSVRHLSALYASCFSMMGDYRKDGAGRIVAILLWKLFVSNLEEEEISPMLSSA